MTCIKRENNSLLMYSRDDNLYNDYLINECQLFTHDNISSCNSSRSSTSSSSSQSTFSSTSHSVDNALFHIVSRYLPQYQAIITTHSNWEITLSNHIAHELLNDTQLNGKSMLEFVDPRYKKLLIDKINTARENDNTSLIFSGDLIPIIKSDGSKSTACLWLKQKIRKGHYVYIWILEEICPSLIEVNLNARNEIQTIDHSLGYDFVFSNMTQLSDLLPTYELGQSSFGCRTSRTVFPVMVEQVGPTRLCLTSMPTWTGFLTLASDGRIIYGHPRFCQYLFGTIPLQQHISTVVPLAAALLETKNFEKVEGIAVHRDGSLFNVDLQMRQEANSEFVLWVQFYRDKIFQKHGHRKSLVYPLPEARGKPLLWPAAGEDYSAQSLKTNIHDYEIVDDLGEGAYGLVKLAYLKNDPEKKRVIIKYVLKERILVDCWRRDRKLGLVPAEIHVLHTLRTIPHINCSDMLDYFEDEDHYYIVMDLYGAGMDLFDYIELKDQGLTEEEVKFIFLQVVSAVAHLHEHRIVHRDIKDENVILDLRGGVRLIDFGSAAYLKEGKSFDTFVGTLDYAAPEILKGGSYTGPPQDIWACGILLYTLIYRENPFYNVDEIMERELRIPYTLSEESVDLIRKMLNRNVEERLTIQQVLQHPWFQS